jgi:hypothetical protein
VKKFKRMIRKDKLQMMEEDMLKNRSRSRSTGSKI